MVWGSLTGFQSDSVPRDSVGLGALHLLTLGLGSTNLNFSSSVVGFQPPNHSKRKYDSCVPTTTMTLSFFSIVSHHELCLFLVFASGHRPSACRRGRPLSFESLSLADSGGVEGAFGWVFFVFPVSFVVVF